MPFNQLTFLGASIRGFTSSIGWNVGQPSQLTVALVEDPVNGDRFNPVPLGTPIFFTFGSFNFFGLLQKYEKKNDVSGNPVYEVICTDPREILDGAQIILNNYNGSVGGVPNLFNAYGWWENNGGFGASQANDAGMPYGQVLAAITTMANTAGGTDYGGPLNYKGVTYSLDLSQMPVPPADYRLGGPSIGLLEMISTICEDGGCDFFVELKGFAIRVRTVSRTHEPPLGTISALVNATTQSGTCVRSSTGVEARNEVTSSFLVGGDVTTLFLSDSLQSYWGLDIIGNPITGFASTFNLFDGNGNVLQVLDVDAFNLNASPVADIIGQTFYPCSDLELRFAKINYNSWSSFMIHQRSGFADRIGLTTLNSVKNMVAGRAFQPGGNNGPRKPDFINDDVQAAKDMAKLALITDLTANAMRMYEYVKGYADEFWGKKYLVPLPFILREVDQETLQVYNSYDVTDGGYLPAGSAPLGLSPLNEDLFKTQDDRFRCFVQYVGLNGLDLTHVSPQGTAVENNTLFAAANCSTQIVFTPTPNAILNLQAPIFEEAVDFVGNLQLMEACFQLQPGEGQKLLLAAQHGTLGVRVSPSVVIPTFAAVPLKSNILQYGPWAAAGSAGKVKFDQDPTLVPWNYGGFDNMNLAGQARVSQAATNMTVIEAGQIELVGAPTASLGDVLQTDGPNITNLDVSYGPQGVSTTYRFQTFTPRYGVFNKHLGDRLKRMGAISQNLGRSVRAAFKDQILRQDTLAAVARTQRAFMENAPKQVKKESPYDMLVGYVEQPDGSGNLRLGMSAMTYEEAVPLANADDDTQFQATGMMSFSGLLRPFCTQPGGGSLMPSYATPTVNGTVANVTNLDPWKDYNDVEVYAWGDTYQGLHAQRRLATGANARPLALRGPLVISGWGFDWQGNAVPGSGSSWDDDTLTRSDKWRVGPLDALWDAARGVWTCHGTARGRTTNNIGPSTSGSMQLYGPDGLTSELLAVWNFSASIGLSGSLDVMASYAPRENKWFIVAADCVG